MEGGKTPGSEILGVCRPVNHPICIRGFQEGLCIMGDEPDTDLSLAQGSPMQCHYQSDVKGYCKSSSVGE